MMTGQAQQNLFPTFSIKNYGSDFLPNWKKLGQDSSWVYICYSRRSTHVKSIPTGPIANFFSSGDGPILIEM